MRAIELRSLINKGVDPMQVKNVPPYPAQVPSSLNFKDFALDYIETMRPKWRNQKHGDQWGNAAGRD